MGVSTISLTHELVSQRIVVRCFFVGVYFLCFFLSTEIHLFRCSVLQTLVSAFGIVERKVLTESVIRCFNGRIVFEINILILHTPPQSFHKDVVETSSPSIHADVDVVCFEDVDIVCRSELCALIRIVDLRRGVRERARERANTERDVQSIRQFPGKNIA